MSLYQGYATGALPRNPKMQDWRLEREPRVASQLAAGVPNSFLVLPLDQIPSNVKINQGAIPKCVASSSCIAKSIEDFQDERAWRVYNDQELYTSCGGNGSTGIYTDDALERLKNIGALAGSGKRSRIESYAFAPQTPGQFRQTLAAALVSTGPCVLASLLSSIFGWDSGENPTDNYHQQALIGYEGLGDDGWAIFLNSWGESFGNRGFTRLRWRYLEGGNFQNRLCYAYKLVDVREGVGPDPEPEPNPEPKPGKVTVTGTAAGGGLEFLKAGIQLQASGAGFSGSVSLTAVTRETPDPEPKPEPKPSGDLLVTVSAQGAILSAKATYQGNPVPASFVGTISGQTLPLKFSSIKPPYAATWVMATWPKGAVTITAVSGTRIGRYSGTL